MGPINPGLDCVHPRWPTARPFWPCPGVPNRPTRPECSTAVRSPHCCARQEPPPYGRMNCRTQTTLPMSRAEPYSSPFSTIALHRDEELTARAEIGQRTRNAAQVGVRAFGHDGRTVASAAMVYGLFPPSGNGRRGVRTGTARWKPVRAWWRWFRPTSAPWAWRFFEPTLPWPFCVYPVTVTRTATGISMRALLWGRPTPAPRWPSRRPLLPRVGRDPATLALTMQSFSTLRGTALIVGRLYQQAGDSFHARVDAIDGADALVATGAVTYRLRL